MKKHTFKDWFAATRYWSFSVSSLPAVATIALMCYYNGFGQINWLNAVLAVVGVVIFHAAGNLLSDVGDYKSGADCEEAFAVPNLVKHIFEPKEYLRLSYALFAIGIAIGLFLTWRCGWQLLVVGGLGFVFTVLYTQSKNVFLSDLNIFVIFGMLIMLGTSLVSTGAIDFRSLLLTIPLGLITLSVLHANNTVDIQSDGNAGLHTLAMAMGQTAAAKTYIVYQVLPFVWVAVCAVLGYLPWTALLCLVAFIPAMGNIKKAARYKEEGRDALIGLDLMSAKLQLIFSLTLAVGLFVAALL